MINKAIAHITDQAMKAGDELSRFLEEHLTEICTNERIAEKLLNEEKTLKEINDQMWAKAEKRRKGNFAGIDSRELYDMLESYYEITEADKQHNRQKSKSNTVIDISGLL